MLTSFQNGDLSRIFVSCGEDRVDAWAPPILQELAFEAGFVLSKTPSDPSLLGEAKDLADRIASIWDRSEKNDAMRMALLTSLREETFGGTQGEEGGVYTLGVLRRLARLMELPRFSALELLPSEKIPKRIPRYEFKGDILSLAWSKGGGLSWEWKGLRSCNELFSLEVQGDRGGEEGFVPGLPERPRRFLAAHMQPFSVSRKKGRMSLGLRRELKLPQNPEEPKGRLQKVDWELRVRGDLEEGYLEALVSLQGLPSGQRVRLLVPVPFFPRPVRWEAQEGTREREGPCPRSGFKGGLSLSAKALSLSIEGPGWREMELFPHKNNHLLALTVYRAPFGWQAPDRIVRKLHVRLGGPENSG